tara:strand:- start:292 stop:498 length:207 start_codon:yes stop_codon:yes gene_type:complete
MTELEELEEIVGRIEDIETFGMEPDFSSLGLEPAEILGFKTDEELENAIRPLTEEKNNNQFFMISLYE